MVRGCNVIGELHRRRRSCIASLLALAGCTASPARDDAGQINAGVLKVLTAGNRSICVDSVARGEPLAIFRTMELAPDPIRRTLAWHLPKPLAEGQSLDSEQLADQELRHQQSLLRERSDGTDFLPRSKQSILNALANQGTLMVPERGVVLPSAPEAPRAKVRWWIRNRIDSSCGPVYTISEPVIFRNFAFVTVTAGHHGNTYAVQKVGSSWNPVAMWSTWLY